MIDYWDRKIAAWRAKIEEHEKLKLFWWGEEEQWKACGCEICRARLLALQGLRVNLISIEQREPSQPVKPQSGSSK